MTGRELVDDLEDAGADPDVIRTVRRGLASIAANIRRQADRPHYLNAIGAAALVDPGNADDDRMRDEDREG